MNLIIFKKIFFFFKFLRKKTVLKMMQYNLDKYNHNFDSKKASASKAYVMISYSWGNKEDVNCIVEKLEPYLNIWRDKNSLAGCDDLWNTYTL